MDLDPGADVNAPRGFVQDEHSGPRRQPAREQDFLLVASRQLRHRLAKVPVAHVELSGQLVRRDLHQAPPEHAEPGNSLQDQQVQVVPNRHRQDEAVELSFLRHVAEVGGPGLAGFSEDRGLAALEDQAALDPLVAARQGFGDHVRPTSPNSEEADDLPLGDLERDPVQALVALGPPVH